MTIKEIYTLLRSATKVIFLTLTGFIMSCQEPREEINYPDPETGFSSKSELAQKISSIALLDGSADNILDNASCLSVLYPVSIILGDQTIVLESVDDLQELVDKFISNPYRKDRPEVIFPIKVLNEKYEEITISSSGDLEKESGECIEGGDDADIEAVDINYPMVLSTYDTKNQLAGTREVHDDYSLHHFVDGLGDEDLISLDYPVSLSAGDHVLNVSSNSEFLEVIYKESEGYDECDGPFFKPNSGGGNGDDIAYGVLSIALTDAPFPLDLIEEANIEITQVQLRTGADNDTVPFITIFDDAAMYNLIELVNGVTIELVSIEVPAGTYESFRLFVDRGEVVLKDGRIFDLKVPSGSTSGIKVKPDVSLVVEEGKQANYLFDVDLSRSFIAKGNPNDPTKINGFNFKPVIKAASVEASGTLSGKVTGPTGQALESVQISVYAGDTLNTTTFTGATGAYKLLGLSPGEYILEAELSGYLVYQSETILIQKAEESNHDVVLEPEE